MKTNRRLAITEERQRRRTHDLVWEAARSQRRSWSIKEHIDTVCCLTRLLGLHLTQLKSFVQDHEVRLADSSGTGIKEDLASVPLALKRVGPPVNQEPVERACVSIPEAI